MAVADESGDIGLINQSPYAAYVGYLRQGQLAYQYSPAAGRAVFFPRLVCPFTGSDVLEWRVSAGRGTVYATTVVHPAKGGPYNVALIDCDEGFRLMSRVADIEPEAVRIGLRVRFGAAPPPEPEGDPIPVFYPDEPV